MLTRKPKPLPRRIGQGVRFTDSAPEMKEEEETRYVFIDDSNGNAWYFNTETHEIREKDNNF